LQNLQSCWLLPTRCQDLIDPSLVAKQIMAYVHWQEIELFRYSGVVEYLLAVPQKNYVYVHRPAGRMESGN
jgi:hypothetical protein